MSSTISLIHLSDIHFQVPKGGSQYDLDADLRNELEIDASKIQQDHGNVQGVLISGDVAFSGKNEEYVIALDWLERLCEILNCPSENVWTTPGNHDVDRSVGENSKLLRNIHEDLRTTEPNAIDKKIQEYMEDAEARDLIYRPLENYNDFAAVFQCEISPENPIWEHDLLLNDESTLRVRGINSTLVSNNLDDDAANRLLVGTSQASPMRQAGVEYLILCHHPPSWLLDRDTVLDFLNSRARIQMFGHKHSPRYTQVDQTMVVAAGATHPDRREPHWRPSYNLIEVSVSNNKEAQRTLQVALSPRTWNDVDKRFQADYGPNGDDSIIYNLPIGDWKGPELPDEPSGTPEVRAPSEQKVAAGEISKKSSEGRLDEMDPGRRLTYRFLRLPYHTKIGVAQKLELIGDDDSGLEDAELFRRFFKRAQERSQLEDLWAEVESAHGDSEASQNPFAEL